MTEHRWSGWPGAYCMNCGIPHGLEEALHCRECHCPMPGDPDQEMRLCAAHTAVQALPCPPTGEQVIEANALLVALYAREAAR